MSEMDSRQDLAQVQDKSPKPSGVLPKNVQAWMVCGIAVVMVTVIAFTPSKPAGKITPPLPVPAASAEAARARIAELDAVIKEQQRKVEREQSELVRRRELFTGSEPALASESSPAGPMYAGGYTPRSYTPSEADAQDELKREEKRREYQSRFASVVALSLRPNERGTLGREVTAPVSSTSEGGTRPTVRAPAASQGADTRKPLTGEGQADTEKGEDSGQKTEADGPSEASRPKRYAELNRFSGKMYRLFEGTWFEAVLTNRLDASFSGPVNCMVTTNVYSHDAQHLLIPQGSRILGEVRKVDNLGQQRLAVFFHRVVMPDGYSLSLDRFKGLNQIGETGLRDKVNHHYAQIFGVAIGIGALAGLSQANTRYSGLDASAGDVYRQSVSASLSQSAMRILDRYLSILPTFTIREGTRVKIYLADDLLVPAYGKHDMPSDL